ncbi:PREDICTED: uncharacterized protein LOC108355259, partial [Rhagoletis zephyria]|uniref:uncharacterized protein LOC108355259 n=1 Tax=Rhagoletis zephyria TaxID=28612 RepID=UPI0008114108
MVTKETHQLSPDNFVVFYKRKAQSIFMQAQAIDQVLQVERLSLLTEAELNVRLESLEQICTRFNSAHDKLEEQDFDEIGGQLRISFDDLLVTLRSRIRHEIGKRQSQLPPCSTLRHDQTSEGQTIIMQSRPRLPELKLPVFSGNYTEYTSFFSMFSTIIGRDPDLTDVERLQHLRSSLKGAALDTIRSLEISSANYTVALELLEKRFNNKRLIFQAHITEILGLKRVDSSSAVKLRELSDKVNANLRALQTIGNLEQIAACIIIHTLLQRVDSVTQAKWEETAPLDTIPSCEQFTAFLEKRCQKLENVEHSIEGNTRISQVGKTSRITNPSRKSFVSTNVSNSCAFCGSTDHAVYSCSRFSNLTPQLRLREAKRLSLCLNCLRRGHQLRACNAGLCRSCGAKHHSLLHFENSDRQVTASAEQNTQPSSQLTTQPVQRTLAALSPSSSASSTTQNLSYDVVLLATSVVNVKNNAGTWVPCRALLDSGSQLHIITSRLAHQLQLRRTKSSILVSDLGDSRFQSDGFTVDINLRSQTSEYSTCIMALVAPSITDNQPNVTLNIASWDIPSNIRLADPDFYKSQRIDMLIGSSLFYELLCVGQIKLAPGLPLLQKT